MEIGDSTETRNVWLCMRFMFICLKTQPKHTALIAEWYNPCVRVPEGTFWSRLRIPPAALFWFLVTARQTDTTTFTIDQVFRRCKIRLVAKRSRR